MSVRGSASKSALLLACSRPFHLGARLEDEGIGEQSTEKRDRGSEVHAALDHYAKTMQVIEGSDADARGMISAGIKWFDERKQSINVLETEVVLILDTFSCNRSKICRGITGREYPKTDAYEVPGTTDLMGVTTEGLPWVADYKTGDGTGVTEQLKTLACALMFAIGGSIIHSGAVAESVYLKADGSYNVVKYTFTYGELVAHAEELYAKLEEVAGKQVPEPSPGAHCAALYCPHAAFCPSVTKLSAKATNRPGLSLTDYPVNDKEAYETIRACDIIKRQSGYYKAAMKEYAMNNGGRISHDGYTWEDKGFGFRFYKENKK